MRARRVFATWFALLLSLLLLTSVTLGSAKKVLLNVPAYPMYSAVCTVKSFQMVVSYYGFNYSETILMELSGWDYGAYYNKRWHIAIGGGEHPLTVLRRLAHLLGFEIKIFNFSRYDVALKALWYYVSKEKVPVIVQLPWHTIVVVGFDDKGVYVHDPCGSILTWQARAILDHLGLSDEVYEYFTRLLKQPTPGAYVFYDYDEFKRIWFTPWMMSFVMIVVKPTEKTAKLPLVDWSTLLKFNANITLGGSGDQEFYGVYAIRALAHDITALNPANVSIRDLYMVKSWFLDILYNRRFAAAQVLYTVASMLNSSRLAEAAWLFERASYEYALASTYIGMALEERDNTMRVAQLVRNASKHMLIGASLEEKAAKLMLEAAKEIRAKRPVQLPVEKKTVTVTKTIISSSQQTLDKLVVLALGVVLGVAVTAVVIAFLRLRSRVGGA